MSSGQTDGRTAVVICVSEKEDEVNKQNLPYSLTNRKKNTHKQKSKGETSDSIQDTIRTVFYHMMFARTKFTNNQHHYYYNHRLHHHIQPLPDDDGLRILRDQTERTPNLSETTLATETKTKTKTETIAHEKLHIRTEQGHCFC